MLLDFGGGRIVGEYSPFGGKQSGCQEDTLPETIDRVAGEKFLKNGKIGLYGISIRFFYNNGEKPDEFPAK